MGFPQTCSHPPILYNPSPRPSRFEQLPAELIAAIFELLPPRALLHASLVSHLIYEYASTVLWRDLELVDCKRVHSLPDGFDSLPTQAFHKLELGGRPVVIDDHDDTPIIQNLYTLASNPRLASKVRTVTHRCHLPTPAIFAELPHMSFSDQSLSSDARTIALLRLAILNMVAVHTLRIIFPHYNICHALLTGFFDPSRPKYSPIRRLWLENCEIQFDLSTALSISPPSDLFVPRTPPLDASGLKSIRIRRLRLDATTDPGTSGFYFALAREGTTVQMQDGRGSLYNTTVSEPTEPGFNNPGPLPDQIEPALREAEQSHASRFYDHRIYSKLQEVKSFLSRSLRGNVSPRGRQHPVESPPCYRQSINITAMLRQSIHTLTSLNLDWLMLAPGQKKSEHSLVQYDFFETLSGLRFHNLRAFQLRNTVCTSTKVPDDVYLLQPTTVTARTERCMPERTCRIDFLSFLEHHAKLECLAWPMGRFFAVGHKYADDFERSKAVALRLGATLKTLRLDSYFDAWGENQTDDREDLPANERSVRSCRRLFIEYFAPHMRAVKTLKLEGGIPRDEKREILRAMHRCPLEKITMIGVTFPLGNTWGKDGIDIRGLQPEEAIPFNSRLEAEDRDSIMASRRLQPCAPPVDFKFRASFGWPPSPPLLFNIASLFSSTVKELKFCGYNGSVVMNSPEVRAKGVTPGILHHLRYCHKLESIVTSFYMHNQLNDSDVIQQWLSEREAEERNFRMSLTPQGNNDASSPRHTSSYPLSNSPGSLFGGVPWNENGDEGVQPLSTKPEDKDLRQLYSSHAIAQQVDETLRPYISPLALEKKEGVSVRASFCMGIECGDVFDMEVRMGQHGVLGFKGPREEGERDRWYGKLNAREYF